MRPIYIGQDDENKRLELTHDDMTTHVHGIGASRSGKSKLIEWMCREMIRGVYPQPFILIDPHGHLYHELLRWLAFVQPRNVKINLFAPAYTNRIVGFNPFRRGAGDVSVQAERRVQATIRAWGVQNTDATGALAYVSLPHAHRW